MAWAVEGMKPLIFSPIIITLSPEPVRKNSRDVLYFTRALSKCQILKAPA
jgi:hypothetical protein